MESAPPVAFGLPAQWGGSEVRISGPAADLGPAACPFTVPWVEAHKVTRLYREAGTGCLPAQRSWRDVLSARKAATQVSFRSLD